MTSTLAVAVLLAPLAFGLVAAFAAANHRTRPVSVQRIGMLAAWFGVAVAAVAGGAVALNGPIQTPTIGTERLGVSLLLDLLSTIMFGMIALLAVVIFRFSCTYLDGDARHGVFLGQLGATVAAVELLVLSGNLLLLVVAWVATSLALHRLLVFYGERRGAVIAARKKYIIARIGDVFLVAAAVVLYREFDTGNLAQIFAEAPDALRGGWSLGPVEIAALCLVVAAIFKSAQFPVHGWLVEVMETPTPVSALLHAGILNAGPFLILRMAFVTDGAALATALLIVVGGTTAVFASIALLAQPSVKVALGYSSAAHMGFMLMVCGIGVFPAVLLHLVAHSFYKAHAFLSSGSVIDEARAAKVSLPRRLGSPVRVAASLGVAAGLYAGVAVLFGVGLYSEPALLVVGAMVVLGTTQLMAPALDSTGPVAGTARAGLLALGVTTAFFSLEAGAHHLLYNTAPHDLGRSGIHLALVIGVLIAFAAVVLLQILEPSRPKSRRRRTIAVHLRNGLYVNAMFDRLVGSLRIQAERS
jgi:NAD(P)H-quinone oxidoreductase subunit 5